MDLCNQWYMYGWLACRPLSIIMAKLGHYMETFQPNSFILAMLIGTIDLYHFTPLSVGRRGGGTGGGGGHKASTKQTC